MVLGDGHRRSLLSGQLPGTTVGLAPTKQYRSETSESHPRIQKQRIVPARIPTESISQTPLGAYSAENQTAAFNRAAYNSVRRQVGNSVTKLAHSRGQLRSATAALLSRAK